MAYSYLLHMADARKVDAARALVAKLHGEECSIVDYEGNGFCWGWGVLGSAHPHLLQHGAVVDVGCTSGAVAVCATLQDLQLERCARDAVYRSRSSDRYSRLVAASSSANTGDNDFHVPAGKELPAVAVFGGWCGSAAITLLADLIGLDYVVVFEARKAVNNNHLFITTNRWAGGGPELAACDLDGVCTRVSALRAGGLTAGAYVVFVPKHYLALQIGAFAPFGSGTSRRPRPGKAAQHR